MTCAINRGFCGKTFNLNYCIQGLDKPLPLCVGDNMRNVNMRLQ